ncbi:venom allergen 5-like [Xylocopa sonorina]|uniref:venom allergen 5-like n=1 Tax=Xylocopa sonorina TaxID=1818115 RepID=UPI00403AE61D
MQRFLCFTIVVALATSIAASSVWDGKCSVNSPEHTLHKYPNASPAAACGTVLSTGFTNAEKNEIVRIHNSLRGYVAAGKETRGNPGPQPRAYNMKTMVWDDALANVAQRWANQCHFGHDSCRNDARFYVGQNAALTGTTGTVKTSPADIAQMWYDEVSKMNKNQVQKFVFSENVGHYTQLVWANSDRLGCGKIVYKPNNWTYYYVVCNYGPGGNIIGEPIYMTRK